MIFTHEVPYLCRWISLLQSIFCSKVALQCAVVTARPKLIPSSMDFRDHWWSSLQQGLHLSLLWALLDWPLPLRAAQLQGQGQRATFPLACWRQVGSRMNKGCIRACCHLLAQWTPTASPGVKRCWNSGHRGLVSRGVGMTFWQGDKRHFFLSLTWWPGTYSSLIRLGSELVIEKHEGKSTFPTSNSGKPLPLSHQLGVAHPSLPPPTQPSKRLGGCPRPARVTPRSDGPNPAELPKGFQKETDCIFGEKKKTQMGIRKPSVYHKTVQIGNTSKLVLFILVLL